MSLNEACSVLTEKLNLLNIHDSCLPGPQEISIQTSSSVSENNNEFLQKISPFFSIKKTVYGGRGCFSNQKISKGTRVLHVKSPVGRTIVRPFRKEVCTWCFHYDDGRSMKFRLKEKIYFCSDSCRSDFTKYDFDGSLVSTMCAAEDLYIKCAGEPSDEDIPTDEDNILKAIHDRWESVSEWETAVFRVKASKRARFYPIVTEDDYSEIRYVISTLHNISRSKNLSKASEDVDQQESNNGKYLEDMNFDEAMKFEIDAFNCLQSSEIDKVKRYPYILNSYTNIYKFVRLVIPESWVHLVTPQNVRDIIGRNLTNAFGTWSHVTQEGEEKEYFGFGVYPSASFFNHSCGSNIKKTRTGASYDFVASRNILPGEELCICYGINGDEPVAQRQERLREWFFDCGCTKCTTELAMA